MYFYFKSAKNLKQEAKNKKKKKKSRKKRIREGYVYYL